MSVELNINKDLGEFTLNINYKSSCRRIGILGASGSGKSLTLKCIAGIEAPQRGRIAVDGRVIYDSENKINLSPQKRRVGYLFQNYALFPNMNVEKNILSGIKGNKNIRRQKAKNIIEKFNLTGFEKRLPSQLSGGQQQRVALARIIASEPDVILLDEPFSALDAYMKEKMQNSLLSMLRDFEGVIITVSHNRDEIYTMSEELIIIDKGVAVAWGSTAEIFKNPPNREAALLTGCKNIAKAEYMGNNTIFIDDWGIELRLNKNINSNIKGAAIRAHDFLLEPKEGEDIISFNITAEEIKEELFEYSIYFKASPNASKTMCFKISSYMWDPKKDGIPTKIYLNQNNLVLLY